MILFTTNIIIETLQTYSGKFVLKLMIISDAYF